MEPHLSAKSIREKGKRNAAAEIFTEIATTGFSAALDVIVDDLLDSDKLIDDTDNIEWCRWLIAGGRTPAEFISHVRSYDNHAKCGLVWIPHVVAYRCRTCGISPCMSICRDCFKRGNHKNHDFNMFLSQAGGACDCGDTSVMKAEGFCSDHGINNRVNKEPPPANLLIVAEAMMPRLLLRLLLHFRIRNSVSANSTDFGEAAKNCDEYCSLLMDLNNMGELMRNVMTKTLINEEVYEKFCNGPFPNTRFGTLLARSKLRYEEALIYFPSPEAPDDYANIPALGETVRHKTLLEEFIFWTFRFEFPQNIVCFLLNMLPDQDYKEHLTRTFVMHYSRIPTVLERSSDTETLSNRVVHMSVQLFSNEALALKMVEELSLLHVMIISLKLMMSKILTRHTLHDPEKNYHFVIDCAKQVMKEHCYWPLVSDFNNVLSHESVALLFLRDDKLIDMWFQFLSMLQGMNVNVRETGSHVEFEPSSYYAAFSCELEASAYPMWSIISHLKSPVHAPLAKKLISFCINYLQDWLDAINFYSPKIEKGEMMHASFHFPLHRYLAAFLSQSVKTMAIDLNDVLPSTELLSLLMTHPMRVQSLFYEILAGIWVRNGIQIKGQAMTYIQANFCNSMVDMDMFFLQICATQLPANQFISSAIELFGVSDWLGMGPMTTPQEMEQDLMLEGLLTFLSMIVSSRTNLGNEEHEQCIIEIAALLVTGDKTHSKLLELLPERSGNAHTRNFEKYLKQLSTYRSPPQGSENLEQGLFIPVPDVWEHHYDPLHVLQRAVHRQDFQSSMDRFTQYVKQIKRMPKSGNVWPPFRLPKPIRKPYNDPAAILTSKIMHAMLLGIFYRAVNSHNISENLLALAVFLLEVAVDYSNESTSTSSALETAAPSTSFYSNRDIPELLNCYPNNNLRENLRYMVSKISLNPPEPQVSPANYNNNTPFDSDIEWDMSETDPLPMLVGSLDTDYSNQALALPQDLSVVRDTTVAVPNRDESMDDDDLSPPVQTNLLSLTLQPYPALTEFREPAHAGTTGMEMVVMRREIPNTAAETNRVTPEMFSSSSSNSSGVMLPFNRVQPVVPSRNTEMLQARPTTTRRLNSGKRRNTEGSIGTPNSDGDSLNIDESILSLLLKLHSQLSGTLDGFSLEDADNDEDSSMDEASTSSSRTSLDSRIGDGPYFIGNLLHKIARVDENCARAINEIRQKLWPNQRERQAEQKAREAREKEERSKRAKERQQRLMQEFANKQKQFMAQAMESDIDINMGDDFEIETPREKEYDCIICNTTSPSTESNPIGLVVLVESSSLVGHRRKTDEQLPLPVCDGDRMNPDRDARLSKEFNRRVELLSSKFGSNSWYLSHNIGWEGGVHVQSCGHHVHLTCQDAYLKSLHTSQRPTNLNVERGEFFCPVCRQLANSVLPLSPQLDRLSPMVRVPVSPFLTLVTELAHLMKENKRPSTTTKFYEAMGRAMGCMTNSTQRNIKRHEPTAQTIFSFVVSIARTNLENEIIQRGGSLISISNIRYKPKRDCIVPLLHVLSLHVRIMINDDRPSRLTNEDWPVRLTNDDWPLYLSSDDWPVWNLWASLCGISFHDSNNMVPSSHTNELIPILLSDPSALMLKFILLAPLQLDQVYFTCIVKTMYNVLFYQIITQLCATLTELECNKILTAFGGYEESGGVRHVGHAMALVLANLDKCAHIRKESVDETMAARNSDTNPIDLKPFEQEVQKLCLPFLRIAALLRHHIYHQELPHVAAPHLEFARLVYFLELVTVSMDWNMFDSTKALCFIPSMDITLPKRWCAELKEVSPPHHITRDLVIHQHMNWQQPRLLRLPREYEKLFTYYHEQICPKCGTVPKESSICLLCGTIVCLKQLCCKEENCCEAVRHSITCGGGTGIFLVVTSTYIIIVRGRRACIWGSLYLDDYDEEDRDLKRGKPLYLSEDRFNLLESQWLSHRFAHTKHTWVWHRESL